MLTYLVPTYRCNTKCRHCYSDKYASEFHIDLDWSTFNGIYRYLDDKCDRYCFIGGEPTLWKFINEAILVLKNKGKRVSVFTNGICSLRVPTDNVIVNANSLLESTVRTTILQNIESYRKRSKLTLRFNIGSDFSRCDVENAVSICKKYADTVSISLLFPIVPHSSTGEMIFELASQLTALSIPVKISRATPLCIFEAGQREYLIKNCQLKGQCGLPSNSILIHPDGKTIQPCVELSLRSNIKEIADHSPKALFSQEVAKKKIDRSAACLDCDFFRSGQCCGGCLSYKSPF